MVAHVKKYEKIDPEFVLKVLRHFYVDDFTCGVESYEQDVDLYKKVKSRFMEENLMFRNGEQVIAIYKSLLIVMSIVRVAMKQY